MKPKEASRDKCGTQQPLNVQNYAILYFLVPLAKPEFIYNGHDQLLRI